MTLTELREDIKNFFQAYEKAKLANFNNNEQERRDYEASLKTYRDLKGVIDTAFDEGKEIGIKKGEEIGIKKRKIEIILENFPDYSIEQLAELTDLTPTEIKQILT